MDMNLPRSTEAISSVNKALIALGAPPVDALYLVVIGFVTIAILSRLQGRDKTGWLLVPFLLGVMLMVRVIPALLRHLLPFPAPVLRAWADRRQISKHYDSYQWRKLFWIGLGLGLYTALAGQPSTARIVVSLVCLLSGVLGLVRWRVVSAHTDPVKNWDDTGRNSASLSNLASK